MMNVIPKKTRRRSEKWKRRVFVFLTLALSLFILELGSFMIWRIAVPEGSKRSVSSLCGVGKAQARKLPNTFWHHDLNPHHPKYAGKLNPKGTKGKDFLLPKPRGEFRIVCLGDSTVEGTGVEPDETFPHYLEAFLARHVAGQTDYEKVKVINAGVGSQNSAFNLAYLTFRLIHFDPDLLVVKSSYNDYLPYCIPGMGYDYTHAFPNPYHRLRPPAFWTLARYSHLLKITGLIALRNEVVVPFPDFSGHLTEKQFQDMDYSANEDKFFVYAENIRSMILICKGRGIPVVLVDLPTSPDFSHFGDDRTFGPRFKNLIARLEQELERIANEEDVSFIRTGPFMNSDFWDHCHCTATGNQKVAQAVAEALMNRPL